MSEFPPPREHAPSYEELLEENAALPRLVAEQQSRIAELEARLADLERRVGRNPRDSSIPPSAEGLAKPPVPNRQQRRAAKRKPGNQAGAGGTHLVRIDDPDEVVVHSPGRCRAVADRGITELPLCPEDRACPAPSAERIFEVFAGCSRQHLLDAHGELIQTFSPELNSLQRQLLDLLGVPAARYR